MRVAVIGAGVIGVTTAYELGSDGHEVTVFEQRSTVAAEASFANAGLVAPGYVAPWAAPGMPRKVLSHLLATHAPVRIGARLDPSTLIWLWRWWRACKPAVYRANRARMHRLADFSRDRLRELTKSLHLDFERAQASSCCCARRATSPSPSRASAPSASSAPLPR
jgi:D-amino-acid dehydrogenase